MNEPLAKKSLGQHWLKDDVILEAICHAADVKPGDAVLEIGPGGGELTKRLLRRGAVVTALEIDASLLRVLKERFSQFTPDQFTLQEGDIRTYDLANMPTNYKIVANIPYYLTSHLLRIISESANHPAKAALLVQKEVAERVCAAAGDMSILSVTTQFYWECQLGAVVPAALFTPPPKVDSQILILTWRKQPLFDVDQRYFIRAVKAGFSNKRKTLLNSLSGGLAMNKNYTAKMLQAAGINPQTRAQELALDDWKRLHDVLHQVK